MINNLFEKRSIYRFYQSFIRRSKNDYDFIKIIFKTCSFKNKINVLDIGCGDSYVLKYIKPYINSYIGIDNSLPIFKVNKNNKYKFISEKIENISNLQIPKNINFIFLNGVIHHLSDNVIETLLKFLMYKFPRAMFLSIDPLNDNNSIINKLMIKLDRGKFIRTIPEYKKIMNNFYQFKTENFFIMSFKLIFHYRFIKIEKIYKELF